MNEPLSNIGFVHAHCADERHKQWQANNPNTPIEIGGWCKLAFKEADKTEHLWIKVTGNNKDVLTGVIDNEPVLVGNVAYKDAVIFKHADIEDYIK